MPLVGCKGEVWLGIGSALLLALAASVAPTLGADSAAKTVFEGQLLSVPGRGPVLKVHNKDYPLAFYAFFFFLILAVIAFAVQQDKRRIRSSNPIVIPRAGVDGVGPRRDEVMVAEVE